MHSHMSRTSCRYGTEWTRARGAPLCERGLQQPQPHARAVLTRARALCADTAAAAAAIAIAAVPQQQQLLLLQPQPHACMACWHTASMGGCGVGCAGQLEKEASDERNASPKSKSKSVSKQSPVRLGATQSRGNAFLHVSPRLRAAPTNEPD